MKTRMLMISTIAIAALCVSFAPTSAQGAKGATSFKDAPITEVLDWAQKELSVGFVYEAADLVDPATKKPVRVSADSVKAKTKAEKTLLLFEVLRRARLVPFQVLGMPGPTYELVAGKDAVRSADIYTNPDDLTGVWFASLAIKLSVAEPKALADRLKPRLSEGVGRIEVLERTHTLIVTDFSNRLRAAWDFAREADTRAARDDDPVIGDFAVRNGEARRYAAALERLRPAEETWKSALNEGSNLLLISGRRDEVARVGERIRKLDSRPQDPAFMEETFTLKTVYITAGEAAITLRELFEPQVKAGSVQVGSFERSRTIVFRGGRLDLKRAKAALKAIDKKPERR